MEGAGVALAVTKLVLDLYIKCKYSSATFHHLHQDLKSFHQALVLTEHYLVHLDDIRTACEELAAEIEKLISKHTSGRFFRRVKVAYEDVQPLRARLSIQMTALHLCASMLRERSLDPDVAGSPRIRQSLSVVLRDMNELWNNYYQHAQSYTEPNPSNRSNRPLKVIVLKNSLSSSSTLDVYLDTPSLKLTESLDRTVSNSDSSIISTIREPLSSPHFVAQPTQKKSCVFDAAMEDNIAVVCDLLVEVSRTTEELPIHTQQVKMLLQQGASFECKDIQYLRTPLIWAIVTGGRGLVNLFLEEKAPIETRDGIWDWTPLIWAVMENKVDILDLLIERGASPTAMDNISSRTALLWAASIGNHLATKLLLEKNEKLIYVTDREGMTPLALAYLGDHLETTRLLVKAGRNSSFELTSELSLLAYAILAKDENFARLLLEHGADAQSTDLDGVPVLILAIQRNLSDTTELLVNKGANLESTNRSGIPALILAVKNQQKDTAAMLVLSGAKLEATDSDGNTALFWAIWHSDEEMVKMLVDRNANVAALSSEGDTLQKLAAWIGNDNIIRLLSSTR